MTFPASMTAASSTAATPQTVSVAVPLEPVTPTPTLPAATETLHHPAVEAILKHFVSDHLPPNLASVSSEFHALAHRTVALVGGSDPEVTVCLRKLLEAKDCAVRAALGR